MICRRDIAWQEAYHTAYVAVSIRSDCRLLRVRRSVAPLLTCCAMSFQFHR